MYNIHTYMHNNVINWTNVYSGLDLPRDIFSLVMNSDSDIQKVQKIVKQCYDNNNLSHNSKLLWHRMAGQILVSGNKYPCTCA